MKNKFYLRFLPGLAIWILIIVLRKEGIFIPVISNHLTDFITIPMYACLIEYMMTGLGYHWQPDLKFFLTSTVYISLLFEVICPMLSEKFTGDFWDVLAYSAGGMIYYLAKVRIFTNQKADSSTS